MPYGFPFQKMQDLYDSLQGAEFQLPAPGDVKTLAKPVQGKGFTLKNPMVIQPMEGCDSDEGGAPTD